MASRLKIIYLHQYFNTPSMSGSTRSFEMARRLVSYGHSVHVVTSIRDSRTGEGRGWKKTNESGVIVHWLPNPYNNSMGFYARIWAFFRFAIFAAVKATNVRADMVFATSTPLTIIVPGLVVSIVKRIPLVFEVRDLWPDVPIALGVLKHPFSKWLAKSLEMIAYRSSKHVVTLAPGMKDDIIAKGIDESKITVIPNGCDLSIFGNDVSHSAVVLRESLSWLRNRKLILYGGAVGRINGVGYLVDIAERILQLDAEVRFVVIGEGAEWDTVKQRAADSGVLDINFFMVPSLPKYELAAWLASADLALALISAPRVLYKDAVQNKFFDSLAAGKPVACNFYGYQANIALDNDVGFIFPPDDPLAAARTILKYLHDDNWLSSVSAKARHLAEGDYSRDVLARRLEDVLMGVQGSDGNGGGKQ